MKHIGLLFALLALPLPALAIDAPAGQTHINNNEVLRGNFTEERQMKGMANPMQTSGHFVVAPSRGLIWSIEQPFPTSTIITPNGLAQDVGGIAMKLPAKNLRHIYDMVGGALAGNWNDLENDFVVTRSGNDAHWQVLLTPRANGTSSLPYATITVSGSRFVEHIVMAKADGNYDAFNFSDAVLTSAPPSPMEITVFNEVKH
jgi:hypothetical protein